MTDDPSRPGATTFEVPLSGPDPDPLAPDEATEPPPNWRKIAGLSALAGVALGIIAAIVIGALADGGEPDRGGATETAPTLAPADASVLVTTPPTLEPIAALPPATVSSATIPAATASSDATTLPLSPDPGDLTAITIPDLTPIPDGLTVDAAPIDFGMAVSALADDLARHGTTMYQWADTERGMRVDIRRDPVNDRDLLTLTQLDLPVTVIVDHAEAVIYLADPADTDQPGRWIRRTADDVLAGSGLPSLRELVSPMLLGPIRPGTVDAATVTDTGEFVDLGEGGHMARRFVVTMPAATVPEWVTYLFGPDWGRPIDDAGVPSVAAFDVYVSESGAIEFVTGGFLIDGAASGFTHRLDTIAEPEPIELPDPTLVTDADLG